jgi:hypothetical protein
VLREQGNEQEVIVNHGDEIEVRLFQLTQDLNDAGEIVGRSWEQVKSCLLPVEKRAVNEYAEFTHEHEGFNGTTASKDHTELAVPVVLGPDSAQAIAPTRRYTQPQIDYETGNKSHPEYPGVTVSTVTSSDDNRRSYSKKITRVSRTTVEEVLDAGDRLVVLEFKSEIGGSRGNPNYSRFKAGRAVELQV